MEDLIASEQNDEEFEDKNHEFEGINEKFEMEMDSEIKQYNHETNFIAIKEEPGDYNLTHYNEYNEDGIEEKFVQKPTPIKRVLIIIFQQFMKESNTNVIFAKKVLPNQTI